MADQGRRFRFSRHGNNERRLYKLTAEQVQAIIEAPEIERENHEGKGRREAWGMVEGRWIQAIYVIESRPVSRTETREVITIVSVWASRDAP